MKNHSMTILADGFLWLEGPRWRQGRLWVSDMFGGKVYTIDDKGNRTVQAEVPKRPSGIGFMPNGTPLVASMQDRKIYKIIDGRLIEHADLSRHATGDVNDMIVDDRGYAYIGNFGYDLHNGEDPRPASMHLVAPDGSVAVACEDLIFPNGTVISDDGRTLIVAESWACRLTAFDRDHEGLLTNRRIFANLGDRQPDGICLDAEGGVWVAAYNTGEVVRVVEGGEVTDRIECGIHVLACALGGDDGKTLFCLPYMGTQEDMAAGKRLARITTTKVAVAGQSR